MALQVWLPLNGNLNNQGLNKMTFSNSNGASTIVINDNGKIGKCYNRSTIQSAGRIISNSTINLNGNISMFCWAKVTGCVGDTANGLVSNHSHSNKSGFGITVKQISGSDFRISCNTGNGRGRTYMTYYGDTNIKDKWCHLGLTYDNTKHEFKLWVNGTCEKTVSYTNSSRDDYIMIFDWSTTYSGNDYKPACFINDVRIYDHCLSSKEVKELSKGLVLHYKLDNLLNNKIYDCSGYLNDGTISGSLTLNDDSPRYNNSTVFSTGKHIYNASSGIPGSSGSELTISCWFYQTDRTGYQGLVGNRGSQGSISSSSPLNWYLYTHTNDGSIQLHGSGQNKSSIIPTLNTWHHVVAVVKTTNKYDLYLDGKKVISDVSYTWGSTTQRTVISGYGNNGENFKGRLSDVRVYCTALSDRDILELYNNPANIDNQGNLLTYEFDEVTNNIFINKKGILSANKFIEEGNITKYFYNKTIKSTQFIEK